MSEPMGSTSFPTGLTIVVVNHNYGRFLNAAIDSALIPSPAG